MKLTIITVNKNNYLGLEKTILSVLNQSVNSFEYVVVDGASHDGSLEVINKYGDRIDKWINEEDNGVYNAMNKAVKISSGDYLLFINSGDELYDKHVVENTLLQLDGTDIIAGNLQVHSDSRHYILKSRKEVSFLDLCIDTIWHPSTFIKKSAFDNVGLYDEKLKISSDWKWFLMALYNFDKTYKSIDLTISKFYLDGLSSLQCNAHIIKKERLELLEDIFNWKQYDIEYLNKLFDDREKLLIIENKISQFKETTIFKLLSRLKIVNIKKYFYL